MARVTQKRAASMIRDPRSILKDASVHIEEEYGALYVIVHSDRGPSVKVRIASGPAGVGIEATAINGSLAIGGNLADDGSVLMPRDIEVREIGACAYFPDAWSQSFKAWYQGKGDQPSLLPPADR